MLAVEALAVTTAPAQIVGVRAAAGVACVGGAAVLHKRRGE